MKNAVIAVLGASFIAAGVVGVFLPFIQGILLIVIGLYLLSLGSPKAHAYLTRLYRRGKELFPKIATLLEKLEKKWEDIICRWQSRKEGK